MTSVLYRAATFLLIALALLFAPLGVCLGGGPAMASGHASAMHHDSRTDTPDHGREGHGKVHYCPECQPPSFVKAGKAAVPDLAPVSAPLAPVAIMQPLAFAPAKSIWAQARSTSPPPLQRTYRVRLQI